MYTLSNKIGFWSAILLALTLILWIVCFISITATSPLFYWTNFSDYLIFIGKNSQFLQNTAKLFMLLFSPLYVVLISSFYDHVSKDKKILIRVSLLFGIAFAVLSSLHYFVQLSSVRINIENGDTAGLEQFIQANPISIISSINMLGWTLFLGLSSLFLLPIFPNGKLSRIIKYALLSNGISCFFGGVGYVLQIDILTFFFMNLGMGGAMLCFAITSAILLRSKNNNLISWEEH